MSEFPQVPTWEQIEQYPWEAIAAQAEKATCHHISSAYFEKAKEAATATDETGEKVYRFLGQIAFLHLEASNEDAPFRAAIIMQNKRSASLEDFGDTALDVVQQLAANTSMPTLKARFNDIMWVTRRRHQSASDAAAGYLESFKQIEATGEWAYDIEGFERGMYLARILGPKKPQFAEFVTFVEEQLAKVEPICEDAYAARLLSLAAEHRTGNYETLGKIAESIGDRLDIAGSTFLAHDYYDLAVRFFQLLADKESEKNILRKKGESLAGLAEHCIGKPGQGYFAGSHHLAMGIECLRRAGVDAAKIKSLHLKLLEWQEKTNSEMSTIKHETDISLLVENVRNRLAGKTLRESILHMAFGHPLIDIEALRKRVLDNAREFPIATLFGGSMLAHDGRVMAHKPGGFTANGEEQESFIVAEMYDQATHIDWSLRAQGYIDICRREIVMSHHPALRDLQFLVLNNPTIPPGHEPLFLKGIVAGFRGEFDVAAHLLVPQVEEIIRHVLKQAGHITSKLDSKLIQEQRLLGTLLGMPETVEIFGEDQVFELRGLLCEKFGHDLRNRLAHGFLTYRQCWGEDVLNIWWIIIRLLCIPILHAEAAESPGEESPEDTASNGDG